MTVLHSDADPRGDEFAANAAAMRALVADLRERVRQSRTAAARRRGSGMSAAASCCRATALPG